MKGLELSRIRPLCLTCLLSFGWPLYPYKLLVWLKWLLGHPRFSLPLSFGAFPVPIALVSHWEQRCESALYCFWTCKPASKRNITAFQIRMRDHSFTAESQPYGTRGWEHPAVTQLGEAGAAGPQSMAEGCCCPGLCQELWGYFFPARTS